MDYKFLIEKIAQQYEDGLPFVIFSLPNNNEVSALLQKNTAVHTIDNFNSNGFIFAPFDSRESSIFIPEKESEILQCELITKSLTINPGELSEEIGVQSQYMKLISKTVDTIKRGNAIKIVISRKKDFKLQKFSIKTLVEQLFSIYPTAFRYLWYHPHTGFWCGATPETLVEINNHSFKTMALAGTQPLSDRQPVLWGPKELDEQQMVTDAILDNLQKVTSVLKISKPFTHQAGSLLHLRTDISGALKNGKATLTTIASALHPTPAVCGTPKKIAKNYILENEGYDRSYYTGFLGHVTEGGNTASLMVNLRCMKIENNCASIFVGGGITADSKAADEWVETQNKMQTMLQVLQPML
ncbi:isochorismate synthase [Aequorivita sp. SDUM287046]|uniref:isochorismate synthase n=1 Tax=Aequorivita aurantiaca TaxID=3053356 RepID=A0ABT8DFC9_9FLAO|nr:isochorismate synthase [Aequorivita aurantiaca]MDN3724046.1 isochorismate synthase [Aequorivita aurantiaca]